MRSVVTLQGSAIKQVTIKMVVMCFSAAWIAMTLVLLSNFRHFGHLLIWLF